MREMTDQEFYDFLYNRYYLWKYKKNYLNRRRKDLEKHTSDEGRLMLKRIREEIFEACEKEIENTEELLKIVKKISGLGVAGAGGLLSILYLEYYGTVDKFLIRSLRSVGGLEKHDVLLKMKEDEIKISDGKILEDILRAKADDLNKRFRSDYWTPRKPDMILWTYRDTQTACCKMRDHFQNLRIHSSVHTD